VLRQSAQHQDPVQIDASVREWNRAMTLLDGHLQDAGPYAVGSSFTLADVVIGLATHRWLASPIERPALPAVAAYCERLRARPAFADQRLDSAKTRLVAGGVDVDPVLRAAPRRRLRQVEGGGRGRSVVEPLGVHARQPGRGRIVLAGALPDGDHAAGERGVLGDARTVLRRCRVRVDLELRADGLGGGESGEAGQSQQAERATQQSHAASCVEWR